MTISIARRRLLAIALGLLALVALPEAASIYLHMSALGPKTIVSAGDGSFPAVPARLQENPY